jgi:site-specific DNA recombinase
VLEATMQRSVVIIPAKTKESLQTTAKLKVAAYCRVSTDHEEQESSYEAQISYYTEKIGNNPDWSMVKIFADEGITGTQDKKRDQFIEMIRLCRKRKIDLILTKSISRFARNTVDTLKYVRELKAIGIGIIFEKENINTLEIETEMILTIMSCFAQAESESISKNVAWGIRQSFREGNVPMHYNTMLGYRKGADGKPEIVPEESEIVKEIYHSYLTGMSLQQIADSLNARRIATKGSNAQWKNNKILNILTNEKYTGDALLQKTYIIDCISKKSRKNNGELPMYLVKNHHEPIISRTEFNRVQEEMARRKSKRKVAEKFCKTEQGKYSAKYALTELLVCGECGTPYRRVTWTAKGFKEIKWRCINRLQYGKKKCHNSPTLSEEVLHKAIVSAINNFCEVKDDVVEILRESISEVLDPSKNGSVLVAQQRLDELANNMNELLRLATTPESSKTAMADIQKFSDEMKALREFIETEKSKVATAEQDTEHMNMVLKRLEQADFTLTEYEDVVVRQMVERITVVDRETVRIRFVGGVELTQEI